MSHGMFYDIYSNMQTRIRHLYTSQKKSANAVEVVVTSSQQMRYVTN
jgi:hypothetical protein